MWSKFMWSKLTGTRSLPANSQGYPGHQVSLFEMIKQCKIHWYTIYTRQTCCICLGLLPKNACHFFPALTNLGPPPLRLNSRIHPHDSPCHSLDLSTGLSQMQTSAGWVVRGGGRTSAVVWGLSWGRKALKRKIKHHTQGNEMETGWVSGWVWIDWVLSRYLKYLNLYRCTILYHLLPQLTDLH